MVGPGKSGNRKGSFQYPWTVSAFPCPCLSPEAVYSHSPRLGHGWVASFLVKTAANQYLSTTLTSPSPWSFASIWPQNTRALLFAAMEVEGL